MSNGEFGAPSTSLILSHSFFPSLSLSLSLSLFLSLSTFSGNSPTFVSKKRVYSCSFLLSWFDITKVMVWHTCMGIGVDGGGEEREGGLRTQLSVDRRVQCPLHSSLSYQLLLLLPPRMSVGSTHQRANINSMTGR